MVYFKRHILCAAPLALVRLQPFNQAVASIVLNGYGSYYIPTYSRGSRPSMNLKSNVIITGGDGTKSNPFRIKLGS